MPDWVYSMGGVVLGALLGYAINQLPPVEQLPGRNLQVWSLAGCVTALLIITGVLQNDPEHAQRWQLGFAVFSTLVAVNGGILFWRVREQQNRADAAALEGERDYRAELLGFLSEEFNDRRSENLTLIEQVDKSLTQTTNRTKQLPPGIVNLTGTQQPERVGKPDISPFPSNFSNPARGTCLQI